MFTEIFSRFPTTMKLAAGAMLLSVAIGVPLGILSAVKQYSALDVINSVTAMFFSSIPAFWLGLLSILLFALKLGWLPSNGADTMKSFILPIVTLALPGAAEILRLTRSTMLEVIRQDYMEARLKERASAGHHGGGHAFWGIAWRFRDHGIRIRHAGGGNPCL